MTDGAIRTPLHELHEELGARMGVFAGHALPLSYPGGQIAEHLQCQSAAALFDVSHMGQILIPAPPEQLETLMPQDLVGLAPGRQRYGFLTNDQGGIRDDLMVANRGDHLFAVVNAANAAADLAHLRAHLPAEPVTGRALLALQGPQAGAVLAAILPAVVGMRFMDHRVIETAHGRLWVSRSGYTGKDGFEISVPAAQAVALARAILGDARVCPAGLGARDSLRLEAGLCLHGADIGPDTTPVEAGLAWAIGAPRRRGGARAGGFPGAGVILAQIESGPPRRRVGLLPEGRAPLRAGAVLHDAAGAEAGRVTSGLFGPGLNRPLAMGLVSAAHAAPGTVLRATLRGRSLAVPVTPLPFHAMTLNHSAERTEPHEIH